MPLAPIRFKLDRSPTSISVSFGQTIIEGSSYSLYASTGFDLGDHGDLLGVVEQIAAKTARLDDSGIAQLNIHSHTITADVSSAADFDLLEARLREALHAMEQTFIEV